MTTAPSSSTSRGNTGKEALHMFIILLLSSSH
jgi:hypothetical protein